MLKETIVEQGGRPFGDAPGRILVPRRGAKRVQLRAGLLLSALGAIMIAGAADSSGQTLSLLAGRLRPKAAPMPS